MPSRIIDPTVPEIHNSDRTLFLRCRRRWNWESALRQNLQKKGGVNPHFWFGTGFHFALEDYHGYNRFNDPRLAWDAYWDARSGEEQPSESGELYSLGRRMLDHYVNVWLPQRDDVSTVWVAGKPLVEVPFTVPIPGTSARFAGTFDRLVQDRYGQYWVLDYKTAKRYDSEKWQTDPQISSYAWAAQQVFGARIEGLIMLQLAKTAPEPPKVLANGRVSQDKRMKTTLTLYRDVVLEQYGEIPDEYEDFILDLEERESDYSGDDFIRWDWIVRSDEALASQESQLREIVRDMLNPELPLYPNFAHQCYYDCPFRSPCLATEDDADPGIILQENYGPRIEETESWRLRIEWPERANVGRESDE